MYKSALTIISLTVLVGLQCIVGQCTGDSQQEKKCSTLGGLWQVAVATKHVTGLSKYRLNRRRRAERRACNRGKAAATTKKEKCDICKDLKASLSFDETGLTEQS